LAFSIYGIYQREIAFGEVALFIEYLLRPHRGQLYSRYSNR